ncbi:MAG: M23 family metallopeptidase, partial [Candidatus Cloacimonas sp.]|nr:M23 family metallopeptidase [Candidatus Cloacimonadota bacterium]
PSIYPAYGRISSPYGWRIHPISGRRIFHNGLDIANQLGSPIYVTAEGVVKETGYNRSYGRYIIITHKFGYETMYAHLQKSLKKRGEQVERGEIIGHMGSSGISTGSHVHYEIRRYGKTVNPYQYLNKMEEDIVITKK